MSTDDTATPDQAATIAALTTHGADPRINVEVDAWAHPAPATSPCDHDWFHGPGVVATPDGYLCVDCTKAWMRWHPGELVSVEVFTLPAGAVKARAA